LVPQSGKGGPPKVAVLLFNGAQIIDVAGPWVVFCTAGFLIHTVAESRDGVPMVFGQKMIPGYTFEDAPEPEILLVPGGGVNGALQNDRLLEWVKKKSRDVKYVMSDCTGAFILGKAGLLAGQTATATYHTIDDLLDFANVKVVHGVRYVDNGKIITAAGLSAGIDAAIHLVSRILGVGEAQSVALSMEYRWEPDSKWARDALADRFLPPELASGNSNINGIQAKLISTEGDTNRWNLRVLVSQPASSSQIVTLLRERVAVSTAVGGMSHRISHLRSGPTFLSGVNNSELRWKFTDDQNHAWNGLGLVEPAPDDKAKFILTLKLSRAS